MAFEAEAVSLSLALHLLSLERNIYSATIMWQSFSHCHSTSPSQCSI